MHPQGYPPLLAWARDHITRLHAPPRADTTTIVTCSSTTALMVPSSFLKHSIPTQLSSIDAPTQLYPSYESV